MKVVGTMFFDNQKLLIDKPRKRSTYQMIGGRVEDGEKPLEAAIRECHEELGDEAIFDNSLFELVASVTPSVYWNILSPGSRVISPPVNFMFSIPARTNPGFI